MEHFSYFNGIFCSLIITIINTKGLPEESFCLHSTKSHSVFIHLFNRFRCFFIISIGSFDNSSIVEWFTMLPQIYL